jgi:hypothetical protein
MLVEFRCRRGRTEAVHADEGALRSDPAIPAHPGRGFNRNARGGAEHLVAVALILRRELLPARHRDDSRADPVKIEQLLRCLAGDLDFRAGRKQRDIARRLRLMQHIGAPRRQVLGRPGLAQHRQALTRQRQHARRRPVPERQFPAFRRLDDIGGPVDIDVGRRPKHRQMLDRLVRRPVLAKPDGIVRHARRPRPAPSAPTAACRRGRSRKTPGRCRHRE